MTTYNINGRHIGHFIAEAGPLAWAGLIFAVIALVALSIWAGRHKEQGQGISPSMVSIIAGLIMLTAAALILLDVGRLFGDIEIMGMGNLPGWLVGAFIIGVLTVALYLGHYLDKWRGKA